MGDMAVNLARHKLNEAIAAIRAEEYEQAQDNIGDVLGQLLGFCRPELRLAGNVSAVLTAADLEPRAGGLVVIDGDEFEAARNDPAVVELHRRAATYVKAYEESRKLEDQPDEAA